MLVSRYFNNLQIELNVVCFLDMKPNQLRWKIGGQAGYGIMSIGQTVSRAFSRGGFFVVGYPEYPSLIRGGHNTTAVRISDEPVFSVDHKVEVLVALNKETVEVDLGEVVPGGAVIYDPSDYKEDPTKLRTDVLWVSVPMTQIVKDHKGERVMRNMIATGATMGLLHYPFERLDTAIREGFAKKGEEVMAKNVEIARIGYETAKASATSGKFPLTMTPVEQPRSHMFLGGNSAIGLGALSAGVQFVAGYPMTPSSSILMYMAKVEQTHGVVFKQTEDEIAAMNMICGAAFAGARAMTATSGGGFSLMVEALGMAGIMEVPVVVVEGQRPGPSTGLPTWTSQGDLLFVISASQGEFPRLVLAPGDVKECYYETGRVFNLADKYQLPVIMLTDKHIAETYVSVEPFDQSKITIERGQLLNAEQAAQMMQQKGWTQFKRHEVTDSGVSPRVIPGTPGAAHICSSYEHDETGWTIEEADKVKAQYDKRMRKLEGLLNDIPGPHWFGPEDAPLTLVCWGSTQGAALQAMEDLAAEDIMINILHFTYLYPFKATETIQALEKTQTVLNVEGNATAQFAQLVRMHTGVEFKHHLLKYDGRPFFPEDIVTKVKDLLRKAI